MNRVLLAATLLTGASLAGAPLAAAAAADSAVPIPVSPGSTTRVLESAHACPTFSWSASAAADGFELALVELPEQRSLAEVANPDAGDREPVWTASVQGAGRSWTPALERCVEPGGRYAWFVRAVRDGAATAWSRPSFFAVRAPSLPDAAAVRALLRAEGGDPGSAGSRLADASADGGNAAGRDSFPVRAPAPAAVTPVLTVGGELTVGELALPHVTGYFGAIQSDTVFPSRASGALRAGTLVVDDSLGAAAANLYVGGFTNDEILQLGEPAIFSMDCGSYCTDLEVRSLSVHNGLYVKGPINFSGFTGWLGSGGSGYFTVPSVSSVKVDDNAADCGARPVVGVVLAETDSGQIGIQASCGSFP